MMSTIQPLHSVLSNSKPHTKITQLIVSLGIGILLLTIIFHKTVEAVLFNGETSLIDEFAILMLVGVAVLIQLNRSAIKKTFLILVAIAVYLILVSLAFGRNTSIFQVVMQSLLHLQLFIILLSIAVIHEYYPGFIKKVFFIAAIASAIGAVAQLVIPSWFAMIFGAPEENTVIQQAFLRIEGVQKNPNALGVFFAFFVVLLIHKKNIINNPGVRLFTIVGSILIIFFTGSRSSLIFVIIGILFSNIRFSKKMGGAIIALLIFAGTGMLENIQERTERNIEDVVLQSVDDTRYTRWLMTYHGTEIAIKNFPIGTGAATFGTALSHGSPLYDEVGIGNIPSVYKGRSIHDSNYGSIMGEFGMVGLIIFYGFGAYFIIQIFRKWWSGIDSDNRSTEKFVWTIFVICLLATFFRPLFSSSYYGAILVLTLFSYIESD